jgi:hypothetical protein
LAALGGVVAYQTFRVQGEPQTDELTISFLGEWRMANGERRMANGERRTANPAAVPVRRLPRSQEWWATGGDWVVTTANPVEQLEVAVTLATPSVGTTLRSCC